MNIEELKLVLDTVQAVSGDAKVVVIAWLSFGLAKNLLVAVTVTAVAWVAARTIRSLCRDYQTVEALNVELGSPVRGEVYTRAEHQSLLTAVRKLKGGAND